MKKNIILSSAFAILVMASCNNKPANESVSTSAPEEKTTVVTDTKPKDGTTIKVDNNGMSIESKDGSKKSSVKIAGDSTKIEISRPK